MLISNNYKELSLKTKKCLIDMSISGNKKRLEVTYTWKKNGNYM